MHSFISKQLRNKMSFDLFVWAISFSLSTRYISLSFKRSETSAVSLLNATALRLKAACMENKASTERFFVQPRPRLPLQIMPQINARALNAHGMRLPSHGSQEIGEGVEMKATEGGEGRGREKLATAHPLTLSPTLATSHFWRWKEVTDTFG